MANISLKRLFEADDFKAKSKETGKLVHFKSKDSYQAALKAGTHEDPNAKKGEQPKADIKPNDMFGGDYSKDRGGEAPKKVNHPTEALPKEIYAKMDTRDSEAGEFNYLSTKDGGFMYGIAEEDGNYYVTLGTEDGDIVKSFGKTKDAGKAAEIFMKNLDMVKSKIKLDLGDVETTGNEEPKTSSKLTSMLPKKASQLDYNHASSIADAVNAETGLDGYVDTDDNTDAIMYHGKQTGNEPTYTLYFGSNSDYGKPDEFRVTLEPTYGNDPAKLAGIIDKSFKSGNDAVKYMAAVAKKYKKEMQMDDAD